MRLLPPKGAILRWTQDKLHALPLSALALNRAWQPQLHKDKMPVHKKSGYHKAALQFIRELFYLNALNPVTSMPVISK